MLKPGQLINSNFIIIRSLGNGNFGETYQAFDQKNQRNCCLKTLNSHSYDFDLLTNEVSNLKKLGHPNVIKTFGYSEKSGETGIDCIVTEYVEGQELQKYIESNSIDPEFAFSILFSIIQGLEEIHAKGIVHRDLKPDNIMISKDGTIKIIDFGIAFTPEDTKSFQDGKRRFGNMYYRAPEQIENQASPASDIYSFGIIFHLLFTGQFPMYNSTVRMFESSPHHAVTNDFDLLFSKLTHPNPDQRTPTCAQAFRELKNLSEIFKRNSIEHTSGVPEDNLFQLGYFEDFDKMIVVLGEQFRKVGENPRWNRIDGLYVDKTEKFNYSNYSSYIAFQLEGRFFKITGDTSLAAIAELLRLYKVHTNYAVVDPKDFLIVQKLPDGLTAVRLSSNFEPLIGSYRGNGFYCYEMSEDELIDLGNAA